MSCFLKHKGEVYISNAETLDDTDGLFLICQDAFLEKSDFFWKLIPIANMENKKLIQDKHFLIRQGILLDSYCTLCKDRIRSLHAMCAPCSFQKMDTEISLFPFNVKKIETFLKEKGLYEVDKIHFNKEIASLKKNRVKNKTG